MVCVFMCVCVCVGICVCIHLNQEARSKYLVWVGVCVCIEMKSLEEVFGGHLLEIWHAYVGIYACSGMDTSECVYMCYN